MGVHGLSGFLRRLGLNNNDAGVVLPAGTCLAIDGNGLVFHLHRVVYSRHRPDVLLGASGSSSSSSTSDDASRHQRLLPAFASLDLAHDVTTTYLSDLTARHGMHLHIVFDRTNVGGGGTMKGRELRTRAERREEEWESVRRLCLHGTLQSPDGDDK